MAKKRHSKVIIDETSTYGKKPEHVINSQGTPEHIRDPIFTMSAHDKAELFIAKMKLETAKKAKSKKPTTKILNTKLKKRGGKKK